MNILSDVEIEEKLLSDDGKENGESWKEYVRELGIHRQDAINLIRHGVYAQHKDTIRQLGVLLDGIENPCEEIIQAMSAPEDMCENKEWRGFNRAIQAMKALLEE